MKTKSFASLAAALALMLTASAALVGCDRGASLSEIEAQTAVPTVFRCRAADGAEVYAEYSDSGWTVLETSAVTAELRFNLPGGETRLWSATVPVIGETGGYKIVTDRTAPSYIALPDGATLSQGGRESYVFGGGAESGGILRYDAQETLTCAGSLICIPVVFNGVCDVLLYDVNTGALSDLSGASYADTDGYIAERLLPEANAVPWTAPEGESAAEYYLRYGATSGTAYHDYYRILAYAPVPSVDGRWIFYLASDGEGRYSCDYMAYDTETGRSMLLSEDSFGVQSLSSHADELFAALPSGEAVIVPWMQSAYDTVRPVTLARFDGERWNTETFDRAEYEKDGAMLAYGCVVVNDDHGTGVRRLAGGAEIALEDVRVMSVSVEELIYNGAASGLCFSGWDALPAIMAQNTVLVPDAENGAYRSVSFGNDIASAMYLSGSALLVNVGDRVEEVKISE